MKESDRIQSGAFSPDEALDLLMAQSPLLDPSDWFVSLTVSRALRETIAREKRWIRLIWSGVGSLALLLIWISVEIHEESQNAALTFATLDSNNWSDGSWLEQ